MHYENFVNLYNLYNIFDIVVHLYADKKNAHSPERFKKERYDLFEFIQDFYLISCGFLKSQEIFFNIPLDKRLKIYYNNTLYHNSGFYAVINFSKN